MKKIAFILVASLTLSGCSLFKTKLVTQAYMPEAPEILLRAPKELHTIKQNNLTITDKTVTVEAPKK